MGNAKNCERYANVTTLLINTQTRVLERVIQDPANNKVYVINEKFIEMLDNTCINYNVGEMEAEGPLLGPLEGVFWKNNTMALHVLCREEKQKELIQHLEKVVIAKDKEKTWNE